MPSAQKVKMSHAVILGDYPSDSIHVCVCECVLKKHREFKNEWLYRSIDWIMNVLVLYYYKAMGPKEQKTNEIVDFTTDRYARVECRNARDGLNDYYCYYGCCVVEATRVFRRPLELISSSAFLFLFFFLFNDFWKKMETTSRTMTQRIIVET